MPRCSWLVRSLGVVQVSGGLAIRCLGEARLWEWPSGVRLVRSRLRYAGLIGHKLVWWAAWGRAVWFMGREMGPISVCPCAQDRGLAGDVLAGLNASGVWHELAVRHLRVLMGWGSSCLGWLLGMSSSRWVLVARALSCCARVLVVRLVLVVSWLGGIPAGEGVGDLGARDMAILSWAGRWAEPSCLAGCGGREGRDLWVLRVDGLGVLVLAWWGGLARWVLLAGGTALRPSSSRVPLSWGSGLRRPR